MVSLRDEKLPRCIIQIQDVVAPSGGGLCTVPFAHTSLLCCVVCWINCQLFRFHPWISPNVPMLISSFEYIITSTTIEISTGHSFSLYITLFPINNLDWWWPLRTLPPQAATMVITTITDTSTTTMRPLVDACDVNQSEWDLVSRSIVWRNVTVPIVNRSGVIETNSRLSVMDLHRRDFHEGTSPLLIATIKWLK